MLGSSTEHPVLVTPVRILDLRLKSKIKNKKKKTTEAQRHGEEQINHESHEWTNDTNYSCYLLIRVIRDSSFFPLVNVFGFYNFLVIQEKENHGDTEARRKTD